MNAAQGEIFPRRYLATASFRGTPAMRPGDATLGEAPAQFMEPVQGRPEQGPLCSVLLSSVAAPSLPLS